MEDNEFKCDVCKDIFIKELTEKEATYQLDKEFPGFAPADCGLVCDDCFNKMFIPLPK